MREEVYARAREVFFDRRVHHTGGRSGVLLYVSLYERMAAVIADQSILERIGPARIDEILPRVHPAPAHGNPHRCAV